MQNTTGRKMWCCKSERNSFFSTTFFGKFTHSRFRKCSHTGSPTHFQQQVGWGTRLYLTNMWGVSALKYFLFVLNKDFKRLWRAHNFTEKSLWCSRSRSDVTIIQYWAQKNNLGLRWGLRWSGGLRLVIGGGLGRRAMTDRSSPPLLRNTSLPRKIANHADSCFV